MNYKRLIAIPCLFVLFTHFSSDNSIDGSKNKPTISINGMFKTVAEQDPYYVTNLRIGGEIKQIPFYKKPERNDLNPATNTTLIDLVEVKSIVIVQYTTPADQRAAQSLRFNNRDYVEVIVISNDAANTPEPYIVESHRTVYCDKPNAAGPIEKEVKINAVEYINIKGYHYNDPEDDPRSKKPVGTQRAHLALDRMQEILTMDTITATEKEELKALRKEAKKALGNPTETKK